MQNRVVTSWHPYFFIIVCVIRNYLTTNALFFHLQRVVHFANLLFGFFN